MNSLFFAVPVLGIMGLLFALFQGQKILKEDSGNERMKEIAKAIAEGAEAFLFAEYRILLFFVCSLFLCIGLGTRSWLSAVAFVLGALLSTLAGYLGMRYATAAKVPVPFPEVPSWLCVCPDSEFSASGYSTFVRRMSAYFPAFLSELPVLLFLPVWVAVFIPRLPMSEQTW